MDLLVTKSLVPFFHRSVWYAHLEPSRNYPIPIRQALVTSFMSLAIAIVL